MKMEKIMISAITAIRRATSLETAKRNDNNIGKKINGDMKILEVADKILKM